jgi:hypothetical protein
MLRRGIVIPEYEEVMKEPDDVASEEVERSDEQQESDDKDSADVISNGIDKSGENDGRSDNPNKNPDEKQVPAFQ